MILGGGKKKSQSEQEQERGHCGGLRNGGVGGWGGLAEAMSCGTLW